MTTRSVNQLNDSSTKQPNYALFWLAWPHGRVCWGITPRGVGNTWSLGPFAHTFSSSEIESWRTAWVCVETESRKLLKDHATISPLDCLVYVPDVNLIKWLQHEQQVETNYFKQFQKLPIIVHCECLKTAPILPSGSGHLPYAKPPSAWLEKRCETLLQHVQNTIT